MAKQRLDTLLVDRGLCESRPQAQRTIQAGEVMVDQQVVDKAGTQIDIAATIVVKAKPPYVSRGGEKLAKALQHWPIVVTDRVCLDGGISTGGFTDCLFQSGAKLVYGIDVGYGQVAWKIRQDPRLRLTERTNLRSLPPEALYTDADPRPDFGVVDVSFISLTKVLAAVWTLLEPPREMVLLVKPQFEVGSDRIGKKGVVRNTDDQAWSIGEVLKTAQALGWGYCDLTWSPLVGPAGNLEYLLWLHQDGTGAWPDLASLEELAQTAKQALTKAVAPPPEEEE
jgi:23S rRNA (cytidine1920-2'-O)/16S rRNA (cytidine1409-2'-O)-methyltransferase